MERYNIQVSVQKVSDEPLTGSARGLQQAVTGKDRIVQNIADVKVQADSEEEAYLRAHKLLDAARGVAT